MTSPDRAWVEPARLAAVATLALATLLPAPGAGQVWSDRLLGIPGVREDLPFSLLLGPWVRNDSYSEHPVRKIDALGLDSEDDLSRMRLVAQAIAESNATLMIRILENDVVLLDSRGSTLTLPYNGRQRRLGGGFRGQVLEAADALTIEIVAPDERQVDTFFREREWLVRWTDIEPRGLPPFQIDTVYERPGPPPDPDSVVTEPRAAIRIVPPERGYGELLSGRVEIQTLIIDPRIVEVEFFLDDERVRRVRKRPFGTRIRLADPPRRQELEVLAYGENQVYLGSDEYPLNEVDRPFAVRIAAMGSLQVDENAAIRVAASLRCPAPRRWSRSTSTGATSPSRPCATLARRLPPAPRARFRSRR